MTDDVRKPWDFFISYANEDRNDAASPLAQALTKRGFNVWLDQNVLSKDSKLEAEIQAGLSNCHYGIVVLSPRFLAKDWPMRELDTLLAIESLDGRYRLIPVLHNLSEPELAFKVPEVVQKRPLTTAHGFERLCDQILERVVQATDRKMSTQLGELGVTELPRFAAPSLLRCPNENCSWLVPDDRPEFLRSAGSEFTLARVGSEWCLVCGACGTPVGSVTLDEAKEIAAQVRVTGLWAPSRGQAHK